VIGIRFINNLNSYLCDSLPIWLIKDIHCCWGLECWRTLWFLGALLVTP